MFTVRYSEAKNTQPAAIPTLCRQAEVLCSPPPQGDTYSLPSSLQHQRLDPMLTSHKVLPRT